MRGRGALALIVALAGCDRVLGIDELPRRTGPEPPGFANAACETCEERSCAAPTAACARDPVCAGLHRCLVACRPDDALCRGACEDGAPGYRQSATFEALDTCRRTSCRADCLGDDSLAKLLPAGCECLVRGCREPNVACLSSAKREGMTGDCERALICMAGHGALNPDVINACTRRYAAGGTELVSLTQCMNQQSCASCTPTEPFACVGNYQWRGGLTVRPKFKATVFNAEGKPVAGARVVACVAPLCGSCGHEPSSTLSQGVSNADGAVTLELAAGFTGCFHAEHPDNLHTQVIWSRPIVEDEAPLSLETIPMMNEATIDLLFATIGAKRDPTRAQALFVARDCTLAEAPGITLDPLDDPDATVLYVRDSLPTKMPPTDKTGAVVIANLTPGLVTLRLRAGSRLVTERSFVARPGHLHEVRMFPNPR